MRGRLGSSKTWWQSWIPKLMPCPLDELQIDLHNHGKRQSHKRIIIIDSTATLPHANWRCTPKELDITYPPHYLNAEKIAWNERRKTPKNVAVKRKCPALHAPWKGYQACDVWVELCLERGSDDTIMYNEATRTIWPTDNIDCNWSRVKHGQKKGDQPGNLEVTQTYLTSKTVERIQIATTPHDISDKIVNDAHTSIKRASLPERDRHATRCTIDRTNRAAAKERSERIAKPEWTTIRT